MHYNDVKKYCKNCGNRLSLRNNRDIIKKNFCSFSCNGSFQLKTKHKSDPEFTSRLIKLCNTSDANKKKSHKGKDNPRWLGGDVEHTCKICNKLFLVPINRHNKGYGICCSKECYKKHHRVEKIKTNCLNCNKEIFDLPKKNRKYCSCSCRMIHLLPKQKMFNTGIELKIKSFLEEKNIQFDFQPLIKDIVNADFLVHPNIVIFADGDYWHSLPYAIKRDEIVNKKLKHTDYVSLRFKEEDINNNFDLVQNKIMETYNARTQ